MGMDWLSKRKFVIVCHEKVVRIPLEGDEILRVHGERTQGVMKTLMNTKKEEHEVHMKLVLESLRKEKLYAKFSKYAAKSVRDTIRFEYCLASSRRWTKSPVLWAEIGESSLTGLEIVQETTGKVVLVKENPKAARDCQKSYADKRRKQLEFEVGDRVLLRVSPWKGVCLADANLHVPLDEIKVDKTLRFVEEPVEIMDREIKKLKRRKIALVKLDGIRNVVLSLPGNTKTR
ncbi:hypothetical protein Tco_0425481 [Tanacetum coccineum]